MVCVRSNHLKNIPKKHSQVAQEELCVQKETVKKFFTKGPGAVCDLTSLYFQESTTTRCSHQQSPYQLLFGEPHIFEDLLGLKICISPDAFFQVNIAGAEILYRTMGELSGVNSNTILLDICCVTGITNCEFHTGRAEILPQLLKSKEDGQLIVAVVNPARAGTALPGGSSHSKLRGHPHTSFCFLQAPW